MTLDMLKIGEEGVITAVNEMSDNKSLRNHLLDMGLIPRTRVMVRKVAPMGDPIEIHLRGYELTLRLDEARQIEVVSAKEEKL
ncbi:MAG: ferrous iron transport protein A [Ruminiclostridium sp.]